MKERVVQDTFISWLNQIFHYSQFPFVFPGSKFFLVFLPPAGAGTHKRIGTFIKLFTSKMWAATWG